MDIRTKFVFTLVAVALASMAVLGISMHAGSDDALRNSRLDLLKALADSKREGADLVFQGWIDRVQLVASRTQLRIALQTHNRGQNPRAQATIERILTDAVEAVEAIEALTVYDLEGDPLASAGQTMEQVGPPLPFSAEPVADGVFYRGLSPTGDNKLRVGFVARLTLEDEPLGDLHVWLEAQALLDLAETRSGMEGTESGETFIVGRDANQVPRVLRRTRPGGQELWVPTQPGGPADPIRKALEGKDSVYTDLIDDRGKTVWAAVTKMYDADLGLVVKVDQDEAQAVLSDVRTKNIELGLSLGAFAIVLGTFLGFRFSKPIVDLAKVADRIKEGTLSARAEVSGEDEVAILASTFNDMADEMEQQLSLLREFQRYFDLSLDMLCIAGPDGWFKRVNPAFERTLGWTTEELLSKSFLAFVHPDDLEKTEVEIGRLAKGRPTISFENRYGVSGGGYRHLMWTAHPDEATGLIYAIARDITELTENRKRTAEQIRSLRHQLEEAQAAKDESS